MWIEQVIVQRATFTVSTWVCWRHFYHIRGTASMCLYETLQFLHFRNVLHVLVAWLLCKHFVGILCVFVVHLCNFLVVFFPLLSLCKLCLAELLNMLHNSKCTHKLDQQSFLASTRLISKVGHMEKCFDLPENIPSFVGSNGAILRGNIHTSIDA